jgi:hypothetical protein
MFPIKTVPYAEVNNVVNLQVKFDSFVWSDVLLTVPNTLYSNLRTKFALRHPISFRHSRISIPDLCNSAVAPRKITYSKG